MNSRPAAPAPPVLRVRNLTRVHRGNEGMFRIVLPRLQLQAGDFCAFVGASGSGKSTLLDLLGLVLAPSSADEFRLASVSGSDVHEIRHVDLALCWHAQQDSELAALRRQHLGYVLQAGGLFPFLSVGQNIDLPRVLCGLPVSRTDTQARMQAFGLPFGYSRPVKQLSGGERQRVAILRALAHSPLLVLADEPTAAVDTDRARSIVQQLRCYAVERSAAVIMVTHDHSLLDTATDRVFELTPEPGEEPGEELCKETGRHTDETALTTGYSTCYAAREVEPRG